VLVPGLVTDDVGGLVDGPLRLVAVLLGQVGRRVLHLLGGLLETIEQTHGESLPHVLV
jgi:hypothetical protein